MSQIENSVTSSPKRIYRKCNPLTVAEKQRISVSRKKGTHKASNVFIQSQLKDELTQLCKDSGVTQKEMVEHWVV